MSTKISLLEVWKEDDNREITIDVSEVGMPIDLMIDDLIKPLLLAYGYSPKLVDQYFLDGEDL